MSDEQQEDVIEPTDEKILEIDPKELSENIKLNDKEAELSQDVNKEIEELYDEFSGFMETKANMVQDDGIKRTIPTGLQLLDAVLGGGFPIGALSIIVGSPGSGKSMLAIQTIGSGQRKFDNFLASFMDSEEATTSIRLANLGVNKPKIKPYCDITVEKVFKHLEATCLFKDAKGMTEIPSISVWDSIANTLCEKERQVEDINSVIGYKARVLSLLIPKYVARCAKYNICWLAVNQLREQLSIGGFTPAKELRFLTAGKSMPGGTILKFNAFTLVEMKAKVPLKAEQYGFEGCVSSCKTVKNKLFPPNVEVDLVGNFNSGFSDFWTNYKFLVDNKRIQASAWNLIKSFPEKKFRTKDAETLYNTDEKFKEEYDKAVKECINTEIIQHYNPDP